MSLPEGRRHLAEVRNRTQTHRRARTGADRGRMQPGRDLPGQLEPGRDVDPALGPLVEPVVGRSRERDQRPRPQHLARGPFRRAASIDPAVIYREVVTGPLQQAPVIWPLRAGGGQREQSRVRGQQGLLRGRGQQRVPGGQQRCPVLAGNVGMFSDGKLLRQLERPLQLGRHHDERAVP